MAITTLHTNDAVGAISRLTNLGLKPYAIGDVLAAVVAQRLVRPRLHEVRRRVRASLPTIRGASATTSATASSSSNVAAVAPTAQVPATRAVSLSTNS